jgi:hypothetical protein
MGVVVAGALAFAVTACGDDDGGDGGGGGMTTEELVRAACEKQQECDPTGFAEDYPGGVDECAAQIPTGASEACQNAARDLAECTVDASCAALESGTACLTEALTALEVCLGSD